MSDPLDTVEAPADLAVFGAAEVPVAFAARTALLVASSAQLLSILQN